MMKRRSSFRGRFWKRVIAYVLVWCLVMNTSVPTLMALGVGDLAGPLPPEVGAVTWGPHTIIPADNGAIIEWNNFNTGAGEIVEFVQPSALSAVLNNISGPITHFRGALEANGRVFVVNPAGIIFHSGSTIDVAQVVLSGLHMTNFADVAATGALPAFSGGSGTVTSQASVHVGSAIYVGKKVYNQSSVFAPDGFIILAAGETVLLTQDGSNILVDVGFTVSAEDYYGDDTTLDILNSSTLQSDRGQIVLAAGDTFSRALKNDGWLVSRNGGSITAHAARVENNERIYTHATASGDGGTVHLSGKEEVVLNRGKTSDAGITSANAGTTGKGGSITIESEGTVTIHPDHEVLAQGGTVEGNGGTIKITSESFVIEGDISASPHNPASENGTLEIDPPIVTVADGPNVGAPDTIYREDIETLSQTGTNLIVRADERITVEDIVLDIIQGGRGDIEFHAPTINFEDTTATDTLSTTTGDIVMAGGAGGVNTGHLETGAAGLGEEPGGIHLSTTDGGDITTRDLTIKGGQTKGDIDVRADGQLTVGTVIVGRDTAIDNDVAGGDAEATVYLESGDDMFLNGPVTADAHTTTSGDATASVRIFAGLNGATSGAGDATIDHDLLARAQSDDGTSYALVEVDTFGEIHWGLDADATAIGDSALVLEVQHTEHDTDAPDEAHVIITEREVIPDLIGNPDGATTHMGNPVGGNVLDNDVESGGGDIDVVSYTQPANGSVVVDEETGEFTYTPNAGYTGQDTFTYTATNGDETTGPITVTIDVMNDPPSLVDDAANTHMNQAVDGNVLTNDTDTDGDPLSVVLDGTDPSHGTVVLNPDGTFTYTPDDGYVGSDSFTYDATDGQLDGTGNPVVATATVTVNIGNNPPVANDDAATTITGNPVSGNVLGNDTDLDGDPLTVVLDGTAPTNGTVELNTDGSFTYTPDPGFVGEDTFTYEITDGQGDAGEPIGAKVTISVGSSLAPSMSPVAPGLERRDIEYSGIPALAKWVAKELGVDADDLDIWVTNALASSRDIQPFNTYARLRTAAVILRDDTGAHIKALTQVINEFASSTAPPTEEQMASIADAIARNAGEDNQYGIAEEYLNALAQYISILNTDMGFTMSEAVALATANYVDQLADRGNANVAAYVKSRLAEL